MIVRPTQEAPTTIELTEVLRRFQNGVPQREAYEFRLDALDRLGIPLWGAFVWAEDGDFSDGFGYGADNTGARVGAWGEILENYYATRTLRDLPRRIISYNELKQANENAVDPVTLCLDAGVNYSPHKQIVWTTAKRYPSGEDVWIPLEAAAISPSDIKNEVAFEDLLFLPITNGLGAGVSLEQAVAHGVLEQVQRDGDSVTFRAMDVGVKIELDAVQDEETKKLLAYLDEQGIEIVPKLAGVVCGIPVVYVVGYDRNLDDAPFNLSLSACGEAAHPDRERALRKALNEYISSRARKRFMHGSLEDMRSVAPAAYCERVEGDALGGDESRALQSVLEWVQMDRQQFFDAIKSPIFDVHSTVAFSNVPTLEGDPVNTAEALSMLLAERLASEGMEILYVDFTPPDANFKVVKVVVPGLEVETMSYNRIGKRNLKRLLERSEQDARFRALAGVGDAPTGALAVYLTEADEHELGGKAWLDPAAVERAVGKLYALYREPNGHTVGKVTAKA